MTTPPASDLTPEQRDQILAAVYRDLFISCPIREGEVRTDEAVEALEMHLDALVEIVRRSTAEAVEPYLAQIHEDVCSCCTHQAVSGFCTQRVPGPCTVYRFAGPILRAIRRALEGMGDERYLAARLGG